MNYRDKRVQQINYYESDFKNFYIFMILFEHNICTLQDSNDRTFERKYIEYVNVYACIHF